MGARQKMGRKEEQPEGSWAHPGKPDGIAKSIRTHHFGRAGLVTQEFDSTEPCTVLTAVELVGQADVEVPTSNSVVGSLPPGLANVVNDLLCGPTNILGAVHLLPSQETLGFQVLVYLGQGCVQVGIVHLCQRGRSPVVIQHNVPPPPREVTDRLRQVRGVRIHHQDSVRDLGSPSKQFEQQL